jgi:hypothetical protein
MASAVSSYLWQLNDVGSKLFGQSMFHPRYLSIFVVWRGLFFYCVMVFCGELVVS